MDEGKACCCPFSELTREAVERLLRRPFRKRRPVVFWSLVLLPLAALALLAAGLLSDGDGLASEPSLALVKVKGAIGDVSEELDWIARISREEMVLGVLVRVDSPGGGAAASQELYWALKRLGESKPVAVSMGGVAASGGLMVAMAGERIFAGPSTVTGSIGVRMDIPQVRELMARLGLGRETLTTAPYKDAGSPLRPLSPKERAYLSSVLEDMHGQFVDLIADSRGMAREKAAALADGRVFTGRAALEKGLVDELGGQEEARAWLCGRTGVDIDQPLVKRPKKRDWLARGLGSLVRGIMEEAAEAADPGPVFLYR